MAAYVISEVEMLDETQAGAIADWRRARLPGMAAATSFAAPPR